ncbi:MAG TPA: methyltransferase domain-containing protein [Anaerolineae bacterium]|nr:methyltransferase domain-containing protein [Anaerolineae bacterium]
MPDWSRWFYDLSYRFSKPDWDTGLTPPEVIAEVENGRSPGRALDLGCGTGTHTIYLAQHGFSVVGVDFSFLLFAFDRPMFRGLYGVTPDTVGQTFEPQFALEDVKRGANRHGRGTAWYRLVRQ